MVKLINISGSRRKQKTNLGEHSGKKNVISITYVGLHSPICELFEAPLGFHIRGPCRDAVDDLRSRHQQLFQENYPQHPLLRAVRTVRAAVWRRVRVFVVANGALFENVPARSSRLATNRNHSRRIHRASIPRPQRERRVGANGN